MPRPRKSRAQHQLQGNYRPSRHGTDAPVEPLAATVPKRFNPAQAEAWRNLMTAGTEFLAESDALAVEMAAVLLAEFRGPDVMPPSRIAQLTRLLGRLGLDPTSRGALDPVRPPEDEDNPFNSFL